MWFYWQPDYCEQEEVNGHCYLTTDGSHFLICIINITRWMVIYKVSNFKMTLTLKFLAIVILQRSSTCPLNLSRREARSSSCFVTCSRSSAFEGVVRCLDCCESSFSLCYGYVESKQPILTWDMNYRSTYNLMSDEFNYWIKPTCPALLTKFASKWHIISGTKYLRTCF